MRDRDLVEVWTLKISLSTAIIETSLQDVRQRAREVAAREVAPFLWNTRGAVMTVRSQGDPALLMELAEWALLNASPGPTGFELVRYRTAPLVQTMDWQGHGRA